MQIFKFNTVASFRNFPNDEMLLSGNWRVALSEITFPTKIENVPTIAAYWRMVEKMLSILTTFASMGSGWVLEEVLKVDVKFARFRPIRGSSYIALPTKIASFAVCSTLEIITSSSASDIAMWQHIICIME